MATKPPELGVAAFESALTSVYDARKAMLDAHEKKVKERSPGD